MRVAAFLVSAAFAAFAFPRAAHAEPRRLTVYLEPDVTTCPDVETIRARLLAALPRRESDDVDVSVVFSRHARGYTVTIALASPLLPARASEGIRVIEHSKTSCSVMIDAVSVTLSLMLDPFEANATDDTKKATPSPQLAAPATPPVETKFALPSAFAFDLGGGITRGVLDQVAPVFELSARWIRPAPWSLGLGFSYQPLHRESAVASAPSSASVAGSVSVWLAGAFAEGCFTAIGDHASMALDVCAMVRSALVSASAVGYPRNGADTAPLVTFGAGPLGSLHLTKDWGLWARASADVPVVRASYAVDGVGTVYDGQHPFFALSLGATFSMP